MTSPNFDESPYWTPTKSDDQTELEHRAEVIEIRLLQIKHFVLEEWLRWRAFKELGDREQEHGCVVNVMAIQEKKQRLKDELAEIKSMN